MSKIVYSDGPTVRVLEGTIQGTDDLGFVIVLSGKLRARIPTNHIIRIEDWQYSENEVKT